MVVSGYLLDRKRLGLALGSMDCQPQTRLKCPFPWFGGKSRVAHVVWPRFGRLRNYVEPFAGSLAMLLGVPRSDGRTETVNDKDAYISNFWRAISADPQQVASYADWPVNENDLHARHAWLVSQKECLVARLEGDPEFFDPKIAGWWVWGISSWIGSGFCSGKGPWTSVDGELVRGEGKCVSRARPHLHSRMGVCKKRPLLGNAGRGVLKKSLSKGDGLLAWFGALSERLNDVRVCCGDWSRVTGPSVLFPSASNGSTGVFLDPPYSDEAGVDGALYSEGDGQVAHDVREWCLENGGDTRLRIALCGYEGEHSMHEDWECVTWKTVGGYGCQGEGNGRDNLGKERIWFSPGCEQAGFGL